MNLPSSKTEYVINILRRKLSLPLKDEVVVTCPNLYGNLLSRGKYDIMSSVACWRAATVTEKQFTSGITNLRQSITSQNLIPSCKRLNQS